MIVALFVAILLTPTAAFASSPEIGVTTAVTVLTTGEPPGETPRQLEIGTDLVANERVVTSASGRAHLIFRDKSALVVAPNSDLVLDEYVYDPETKTGRVAFSTTKGFFRFIGGAVSKKNAVEFRTPLATIGIRGGIADIEIETDKVTATKHFGLNVKVTPTGISSQAGSAPIQRNGYQAVVTRGEDGVAFQKATPGALMRNLGRFSGGTPALAPPAGGGGVQIASVPTDRTRVVNAGSGIRPASLSPDPTERDGRLRNPVPGSPSDRIPDPVPDNQNGPPDKERIEPTGLGPNSSASGGGDQVGNGGGNGDGNAGGNQDANSGGSDGGNQGGSSTDGGSGNGTGGGGSQGGGGAYVVFGEVVSPPAPFGRPGVLLFAPPQNLADAVIAPGTPSTAPALDGVSFAFNLTYLIFAGSDFDQDQIEFAVADLGDFVLPVPTLGQLFPLIPGETDTPFGQVSGDGYVAPTLEFFLFTFDDLDLALAGGNVADFAYIYGGLPFTGDFPTDGFATHAFGFAGGPDVRPGIALDDIGDPTLYSRYAPTIGPDLSPDERSVAALAAVAFEGSGADQRSAMVGFTGNYVRLRREEGGPRDGPFELAGGIRGSWRNGSGDYARSLVAPLTTVLGEDDYSFFGSDAPNYFVMDTTEASRTFPGVRVADTVGLYRDLDDPADPDPFFAAGTAIVDPARAPVDLGLRRTTRTLAGYMGGIAEVRSQGVLSDYVFTNQSDDSILQASLEIKTDAATNRAAGVIEVWNVNGANGALYRLGGLSDPGARSAFIDDRLFAMRDPVEDGGRLGLGLFNAVGSGETPQFIGDAIERGDALLVTSGMVGDVLPDGETACTCEYLQWGYWSAEARTGEASDDPFRHEQVHMATWVAGEIPDEIEIPTTGVATYNGHMVGSVNNNGNNYVAAGKFTHRYDFGARRGRFRVTDFDGTNYGSLDFDNTISPANGPRSDFRDIEGLAGDQGGRVMRVKGSIFKSPTDAAKYNAGSFSVTGEGYKAGGTYTGQR